MTQPGVQEESQYNEIIKSFRELRSRTPISVYDIQTWLGQHINRACEEKVGTPGRPIKDIGYDKTVLIIEDNRVLIAAQTHWRYASMSDKPPALRSLVDAFEGIAFKDISTKPSANIMKATLVIDLNMWPALVKSMLWTSLHAAFVNEFTQPPQKKYMLYIASALRQQYFPMLTDNQVEVAANLGMLDNTYDFFNWLHDTAAVKTHASSVLPNDFGG